MPVMTQNLRELNGRIMVIDYRAAARLASDSVGSIINLADPTVVLLNDVDRCGNYSELLSALDETSDQGRARVLGHEILAGQLLIETEDRVRKLIDAADASPPDDEPQPESASQEGAG